RDAWFTQHLSTLTVEQHRLLEQAIPILKELAEK
ncbi:MAG: MarR family transcriptional regulator, partial [Microbacteriaceae bacterium]|nr:MarR family transcriptional regulator [Microbacteriaceae bacterium]